MDIQELRYFVTAYENSSYATAARKLFLSRQALRQKLQRLEEELKGPLFLMDKKKLEPTELGKRLYQESHNIVRQFDAMEQIMLAYTHQENTEITLAMGLGAISFLSHDVLLSFQKIYPHIELKIMENSDTVVMEQISSGQADLGIVGAAKNLLNNVDAVRIQKSHLYLHIHNENPLCHKEYLQIPDLQGQIFISSGDQSHRHQFLTKECQAYGFIPDFQFCTQDSQAIHAIAREYKAITWSYPPERLEYSRPDFTVVQLRTSDPSWGTYIISQQGCDHSICVRLLIEHLCNCAVDI